MIRTDTNPWVLVAIKNMKPPAFYGMEMYNNNGKDYQWSNDYLTQCQRTISVLPDGPYRVLDNTARTIRMPAVYVLPECHLYLAQQPESTWSPMMQALTAAGVGYAITRVPKRIIPFRPYVPGNKCTFMVGGSRKTIKTLRGTKLTIKSEPDRRRKKERKTKS